MCQDRDLPPRCQADVGNTPEHSELWLGTVPEQIPPPGHCSKRIKIWEPQAWAGPAAGLRGLVLFNRPSQAVLTWGLAPCAHALLSRVQLAG